jgi:adenylyltransferase/sulfurtransferase
MVIGATDNFDSRKCIDEVTKKHKKAFIHASIGEFQGQVSVFNYKDGPSYSDLFPDIPLNWDERPATGVIGVLPGITGTMMAAEVIKVILNMGDIMSGKLMVFDMNSISYNVMQFN